MLSSCKDYAVLACMGNTLYCEISTNPLGKTLMMEFVEINKDI